MIPYGSLRAPRSARDPRLYAARAARGAWSVEKLWVAVVLVHRRDDALPHPRLARADDAREQREHLVALDLLERRQHEVGEVPGLPRLVERARADAQARIVLRAERALDALQAVAPAG